MTTEFTDRVWNEVWGDIKDNECFPAVRPILTHYTSVPVLESIARNSQLWLSHPMLMNDEEELYWGMTESRRMLELHKGLQDAFGDPDAYRLFRGAYEKVHAEYGSGDAFNVYITCFCEHSANEQNGLLSMWRAYGANGGGAALVIDTGKVHPVDSSPLILHPVTYASVEQRKAWINGKLDVVASLIDGESLSLELVEWLAKTLLERFKQFALFTKHDGFFEEREWRLAYFPERDAGGLYTEALSYAITDRGIQPKLKLALRNHPSDVSLDLEAIVSEVVLGPRAGSPLARMAVERMLEQCGKPLLADRIRACTTPFRA